MLLGRSLALSALPRRKDVVGVGLSDGHHYATGLKRAFNYKNTFLHRRPRLDLLAPPAELEGTLDFLVASEVVEHVKPPVSAAFEAARGLLKDGGLLVMTTPFDATPGARTLERYPRLHQFEVVARGSGLVLLNRTSEGDVESFDDPPLHGGAGLVLEMRVFSLEDLKRDLLAAGFHEVEAWDRETPEFGIVWNEPHSRPLVAIA
jgi:hypothetical protein